MGAEEDETDEIVDTAIYEKEREEERERIKKETFHRRSRVGRSWL